MSKKMSKVLLLATSISLSGMLFLGTAAHALFQSYPTVRSGSTGGYVKALQANLWASGYQSTVGTIDGSYGSGTVSGVRAFQTREGLSSDGVAGSGTWSRMDSYVRVASGFNRYVYSHPGSTTYDNYYTHIYTNVDETQTYYLQYRSSGSIVSSGVVYSRIIN